MVLEVESALGKSFFLSFLHMYLNWHAVVTRYFVSVLLGDTDILSELGAVAQVKVQNVLCCKSSRCVGRYTKGIITGTDQAALPHTCCHIEHDTDGTKAMAMTAQSPQCSPPHNTPTFYFQRVELGLLIIIAFYYKKPHKVAPPSAEVSHGLPS